MTTILGKVGALHAKHVERRQRHLTGLADHPKHRLMFVLSETAAIILIILTGWLYYGA